MNHHANMRDDTSEVTKREFKISQLMAITATPVSAIVQG